jgi:3-oxoacyl-[acyl-carrier protein] reductase
MKIDLSGKTALITGATGQLGRVMAQTLAECGADIVIHYHRNKEKAEELQNKITALGRKAFCVQADITAFGDIIRMKELLKKSFSLPDIVVNNAVIQYSWTTVLEQSAEDYESQFKSCVMQNVYMAKAFIPFMIEKKSGRFIGINTECAMTNYPTQSAYVSGKRGMDGVLRVLAKEIGGHNITVNQVAPGWTVSERDRAAGTEYSRDYCEKVPLKRRGTDKEIANAVAFLASELASFITGAYIPVCGGAVMPCI